MATNTDDLALADKLDAFVTKYGPLNHKFQTETLPKLWDRVKTLNRRGLHTQADRLAAQTERLELKSKALGKKIEAAMEKMLRIRNRIPNRDRPY